MSGSSVVERTETSPRWRRWGGWVLLFLVLTAASAAVTIHYVQDHKSLSFQDEYVYIDAVDKATRGVVTRQNAPIDELAMLEISCRGVELFGYFGSPCGEPLDRAQFPWHGGHSSAAIHSPVYFFMTAWGAEAIRAVSPGHSLLSAARLTGALWLGLGLTVVYALMRELRCSRTATWATLLLLLASPSVHWSNSYVTPDALCILAGASIGLAGVRYARRTWPLWPLVLLSGFMSLVKFQMVFASVTLVLLGLLMLVTARGRDERRAALVTTGGFTLATVVGLVLQFGYQAIRARTVYTQLPPIDESAPWSADFALSQLDNFLLPLYQGPAATNGGYIANVGVPGAVPTVAAVLLVASLFAAAVLPLGLDRIARLLMGATLLAILGLGPAFYTYISVTLGSLFDLGPRYGLALLPLVAVAVGLVMQGAWRSRGVLAASALTLVLEWSRNKPL